MEKNHSFIAQSKNNLAELFIDIGDYSKAEEYYKQAMDIRYKKFGKFNQNTAESINNLASIHHQLGNYPEAQRLYTLSLDTWKKVSGKKSSGYATTLNKLGELYHDLGDLGKAEEYYKQAMELRQLMFHNETSPVAVHNMNNPQVAQSMNNLALLFYQKYKYTEAEEYYKQALNIWKNVYGEKNISYAITLNNLAQLYARTNRQDKAIQLMKEVINIDDDLIGQIFSIGSERQRMAFLNVINKNFHNFLSLTNQFFSDSKEDIKYALNLNIRRKGIGAEALTTTRDAILSGKYPEMETKLRELNNLRKQIGMKTLAGHDETETLDTHNQILTQWNNRKENLEADLSNHIPEIGLEQKLKTANLEMITQVLPTKAVLIELVKFNFTDFSNQNNIAENERSHYLAFVIYGNITNDIQMIDLGDSEIIDDKINKFRNTITGENQNRNFILVSSSPKASISNSSYMEDLMVTLNPLLKAIGNHKRIFISPDGDFTKFPFELLPFGPSNRHILEDSIISYITTSRDLIAFNNSPITIRSHNNSLVIADPDFDLSTSEILGNNISSNNIFTYTKPGIQSQNNKSSFRQSRDLDLNL